MTEKTVAKPAAAATTAKPKLQVKKAAAKPAVKPTVKEAPVEEKEVQTLAADTSTGEDLAQDDLIESTAHQIENLKADAAFKLVPDLLDNIDHDYFKLGGVLSVIQGQGWFLDKGFENFRNFVETEYGIAYRKAMYLVQIYNGLVESGVKWSQVKHLGWTKLKELSGILTPENVEEWVGTAENMTVLQLQEHIKQQSAGASTGGDNPGEGSEEATKVTTMTFKLHEDQKATVREAIDKAKHETGTEFDAVALEHIALDFLGGTKVKNIPTLKELMTGKSPEEILTVFGEIFPEVTLEVTIPEEE